MTKIMVMRTEEPMPADNMLEGARRMLFGALDGLGDASRKSWRKLWRRISHMEPGEIINVEAIIPRNPRFHRKFFALLQVGFDAWEPVRKHKTYKGRPVEKNFKAFREEVTILAGFYEQTFDLHGRMKLRAKSIGFSAMEDPEFEQVYSAVADVLLRHVLTQYAGREELDAVVERVIGFV